MQQARRCANTDRPKPQRKEPIMANGSVTQAINAHSIGAAIAQARRECADSQRWLNAVNRAAVELMLPGWQFDGETLRMPSATNPDDKYTIDASGCNCRAGRAGSPCKHRAARRLLIKAAELAEKATQPRKSYEQVCADADALY